MGKSICLSCVMYCIEHAMENTSNANNRKPSLTSLFSHADTGYEWETKAWVKLITLVIKLWILEFPHPYTY